MSMKTFDEISASIFEKGNKMSWTNAMVRSNGIPLDSTSLFKTFAAASQYALSNAVAYEGQIIAVTEDGKQVAYVLDHTVGTGLRRVGQDPSDIIAVAACYALSAENVARTELSIAMTTTAGTGDILSTYTFTQGGESVGTISIPKDKVIKSASVVKFNTDEEAKEATGDPDAKAGTYLKLVIQNQTKAIYVPVPELVNTYKGYDGNTISVSVVHGSGEDYTISAFVKNSSIGSEHLTTSLSTYIKTVVDEQAADRSAIAILSGDDTTEGSVKKALKDAKAYTDTLSVAVDTKINTEKSARETAITNLSTELKGDISTEKSARETAVTNLSTELKGDISTEKSARITAVTNLSTELKGEISTEKLTRETAITNLSTELKGEISTEKLTRETAITNLSTELKGDISTEASRAKAAENNLQLTINTISTDLDTLESGFTTLTGTTLPLSVSNLKGLIDTEKSARETAVTNLSTELKGDISTEKSARETAVTNLSTELKGDISTEKSARETAVTNLSTELKGEISTEVTRAKAAESAIETTVTTLSGEVAAISANHEGRLVTVEDKVAKLSSAMHFKGVNLTVELSTGSTTLPIPPYKTGEAAKDGDVVIVKDSKEFVWANNQWNELGAEGVWATKAALDAEVIARKADDLVLSNAITAEVSRAKGAESTISNDLSTLSSAYNTFVGTTYVADKAALEAADAYLSTKIDTKVKVGSGTYAEGATSATYSLVSSDLSVVKISDEDYYRLVTDGKQDDNVIYIVSSDYVNGHNKRVINVGTAISATDAVNLSGMTAAIDKAKSEIVAGSLSGVTLNGETFTVENNVASLDISCINCGNAN